MTDHDGVLLRTIRRHAPLRRIEREDRKAPFTPDLVPRGTVKVHMRGQVSGTPGCFIGKPMRLDVHISDKATIRIEGRGNQTLHWITVATIIKSGSYSIPALMEMRATVWGNSGTVQATQRP